MNEKKIPIAMFTAVSAAAVLAAIVNKKIRDSYKMGYEACEEKYVDWVDENIMLKNRIKKLNELINGNENESAKSF